MVKRRRRPSAWAILLSSALLAMAVPEAAAQLKTIRTTEFTGKFDFDATFRDWMDRLGVTSTVGPKMGTEAFQAAVSVVADHMQWESNKEGQPGLWEYERVFMAWPFTGRVRLKGDVGLCEDVFNSRSCTHVSAVRCWQDTAGALACSAVRQGARNVVNGTENPLTLRDVVSRDGKHLSTDLTGSTISYWRAAPLLKTSINTSRLLRSGVGNTALFMVSDTPLSPCSNLSVLVPHITGAAAGSQSLQCRRATLTAAGNNGPALAYWLPTSLAAPSSCSEANITIRRVEQGDMARMYGTITCPRISGGAGRPSVDCWGFSALFGFGDDSEIIGKNQEFNAERLPEAGLSVLFLACMNAQYCLAWRDRLASIDACRSLMAGGASAAHVTLKADSPAACEERGDPVPAAIGPDIDALKRIAADVSGPTGFTDRPLDYSNASEWGNFYAGEVYWEPVAVGCAASGDSAEVSRKRGAFVLDATGAGYVKTLADSLQLKLRALQVGFLMTGTAIGTVFYSGLTTSAHGVIERLTFGCCTGHPATSNCINIGLYVLASSTGLLSMYQAAESFGRNSFADVLPKNEAEFWTHGNDRYVLVYYDVRVETDGELWTFVVLLCLAFLVFVILLHGVCRHHTSAERSMRPNVLPKMELSDVDSEAGHAVARCTKCLAL